MHISEIVIYRFHISTFHRNGWFRFLVNYFGQYGSTFGATS